ncbi:hypothetical protein K431DRAFT_36092 [Polychaeton citri CBS 116435]|uniref:Secreted protein n=1 Tax=Polychaeton citri CBS 116435 TaxID=1314669 RepID=A0A9P4UNZ3_9PEZI|nr:hypothetical protein K431DRAFT_36092 [Polychaeton citri CBS 116435]
MRKRKGGKRRGEREGKQGFACFVFLLLLPVSLAFPCLDRHTRAHTGIIIKRIGLGGMDGQTDGRLVSLLVCFGSFSLFFPSFLPHFTVSHRNCLLQREHCCEMDSLSDE